MTMHELLEQKIKPLITAYPPIEKILASYNIGCTTCNIGDCLFREIVDIHNLSVADEQALFTAIAAVVFPGQQVEIPHLARTVKAVDPSRKLSPPVAMLVAEHVHILKVVAYAASLNATLDLNVATVKQRLLDVVDFIRNYADAFHHAKEEEILFPVVGEESDVIRIMKAEHVMGRDFIKAALVGVDTGDSSEVASNLNQYAALLKEHIKREDEVLFPWIDRGLTDSQVGQLFGQFREVQARFGKRPVEQELFAAGLVVE